uniref:Uncharacterized protein n=1 Tax=Rhipicephalus appendiculatus TaxID=34631 RepID=A0A131Y990_RHIAP
MQIHTLKVADQTCASLLIVAKSYSCFRNMVYICKSWQLAKLHHVRLRVTWQKGKNDTMHAFASTFVNGKWSKHCTAKHHS